MYVEESSAICAELLDRDLRRGRPARDNLIEDRGPICVGRRIEEARGRVRPKRLDDPLRHEDEREDDREREQDVEDRSKYAQAEYLAQRDKVGLWSQGQVQAPWEWRKAKKAVK